MAFSNDVIFPNKIAFGSTEMTGGREVRVIETRDGSRWTSARRSKSIRRYNISTGIKKYDDLLTVKEMYETHGHNENGFLFWAPIDNNTSGTWNGTVTDTDVEIGTGDGVTTDFQLVRIMTQGSKTYSWNVLKPKTGTVVAALNGTPTTAFTVDVTTGIISFTVAPSGGVVITAGFQYYIPVVFEDPELEIDLDSFNHGQLAPIYLRELLAT